MTREAVAAESVPGGFGVVYPVLKGMEEAGRIRRGYFVAGLGATQFALPGALDLLRSLRDEPETPEVVLLAATDPANPYGATLKWPERSKAARRAPRGDRSQGGSEPADERREGRDAARAPTRSVGASVVLVNGAIAAYLARGDRHLVTWIADTEPERSNVARAVARALVDRARSGADAPRGMLIEEIDGMPPANHPLAPFLRQAGFISGALGMQAAVRRSHQSPVVSHQSQSPVDQSQSPVDQSQSPVDRSQSPVDSLSRQSSVESHNPEFDANGAQPARTASLASARTHRARRRTKSTVSSPFARRYFDPDTDNADSNPEDAPERSGSKKIDEDRD